MEPPGNDTSPLHNVRRELISLSVSPFFTWKQDGSNGTRICDLRGGCDASTVLHQTHIPTDRHCLKRRRNCWCKESSSSWSWLFVGSACSRTRTCGLHNGYDALKTRRWGHSSWGRCVPIDRRSLWPGVGGRRWRAGMRNRWLDSNPTWTGDLRSGCGARIGGHTAVIFYQSECVRWRRGDHRSCSRVCSDRTHHRRQQFVRQRSTGWVRGKRWRNWLWETFWSRVDVWLLIFDLTVKASFLNGWSYSVFRMMRGGRWK